MKRFLLVIAATCFAATSMAQIGIGTTSPQAALDVSSTTQGILIPRMTTAQRTAMSSPVTSTMVYDTSLGEYYYYNGTGWTALVPKADSKIYQVFKTGGTTIGSDIPWNSVSGQGTALSYAGTQITLPANKTFMITSYIANASSGGLSNGNWYQYQVVDASTNGISSFIYSTPSHVVLRSNNLDESDAGQPAMAMIKTGSSAKNIKFKYVTGNAPSYINTTGGDGVPVTMLFVQEL